MFTIVTTEEYNKWFLTQTFKIKTLVKGRQLRIQDNGHFGDHKKINGEVSELRWENGTRVYYSELPQNVIVILLGGNKNGQSKDITQAKKIYKKFIAKIDLSRY